MNFEILILGSDANAYYMARCAYEAYHKKAHLLAKERLSFTKFSNILTIEYHPDLWDEKVCLDLINEYLKKNESKKVLIVSTNEFYSSVLARYKKKILKNGVFFDQDLKKLESLTNKEIFYKTYKNSELDFPETYYFNVSLNTLLPTFTYPIILKPANVILYNHLSFEGKKKIYKLNSEQEVRDVILKIKNAGYTDCLILQEYIPGDDSYLFDSVVYVDRNRKVKLISFAQIGLQEHTKSMVGNAACLINGFSSFSADIPKMKEKIIQFMESKVMQNGFYEFDLKYNAREKKFQVLEINARQGRSSYYLTSLHANLIEVMVDDLIFQKDIPKRDLKDKCLLSFVPKNIIKTYVKNDEFKKEALFLWKKRVSPMECKLDKNIWRFLMMRKRLWHYRKEYSESDWEA